MIGAIVEESRRGGSRGEEGGATARFLGEDDAIEELDLGGVGRIGFTLVNELVECLRLLQHSNILLLITRQTPDEAIDVETVHLAVTLLLPTWTVQILPVGVEEACKTADEGGSYSVGVEC